VWGHPLPSPPALGWVGKRHAGRASDCKGEARPREAQGALVGWSSLSLGGEGVEIGAVALQEHSREKQSKT